MSSKRMPILMALVLSLVGFGASLTRAAEHTATIKGYVVDSACAFVRNINKPISQDCALKCARGGSPLVILADDGILYWPISDSMPAVGQNERLMKFAGQRVLVTGRILVRGSAHAMVISKIEAVHEGK